MVKQKLKCLNCSQEFVPSVINISDDGSDEYQCTLCNYVFNRTQYDAYNVGYQKGVLHTKAKFQAYFKKKFDFIKQQKKSNAMLIGIDIEYDKITAAWEIVFRELMENVKK